MQRKRNRNYHIKGNIGITVYYSRQHNAYNYYHNKSKSDDHSIRQNTCKFCSKTTAKTGEHNNYHHDHKGSSQNAAAKQCGISYGFENYGNGTGYYTWVCMTAFPEDWK